MVKEAVAGATVMARHLAITLRAPLAGFLDLVF